MPVSQQIVSEYRRDPDFNCEIHEGWTKAARQQEQKSTRSWVPARPQCPGPQASVAALEAVPWGAGDSLVAVPWPCLSAPCEGTVLLLQIFPFIKSFSAFLQCKGKYWCASELNRIISRTYSSSPLFPGVPFLIPVACIALYFKIFFFHILFCHLLNIRIFSVCSNPTYSGNLARQGFVARELTVRGLIPSIVFLWWNKKWNCSNLACPFLSQIKN